MRALLAAQAAAASEPRKPRLGGALKSLLVPKSAPKPIPPLLLPTPRSSGSQTATDTEEDPPLLSDDRASAADYGPVPPQVLLGDLAPRRPAFGQRSEPVLELCEPAPPPTQRLTLTAPDGATVGEIILHGGELGIANDIPIRRRIEPQHSEAPFFPEDLADEPQAYAPPSRRRAPVAVAPPSGPEMAATFLLATLAARLASEEAALNSKLSMALSFSEAA